MASVKKYNLAGVAANVELGKKGSYIAGNADAIGFYTSGGALQKLAIANASLSDQAVTKAQLDELSNDLLQHVTVDVSHDSGTGALATVAEGSRVISVTVDIPASWTGSGIDNTNTYIEVGDGDNGSRFIRAQDVDVLKAGQYHSQFQFEYLSETNLSYNITQGSAATGSATISVVIASDSVDVTDYGSINEAQTENEDLGNITL